MQYLPYSFASSRIAYYNNVNYFQIHLHVKNLTQTLNIDYIFCINLFPYLFIYLFTYLHNIIGFYITCKMSLFLHSSNEFKHLHVQCHIFTLTQICIESTLRWIKNNN